jgi:hypothetical protein
LKREVTAHWPFTWLDLPCTTQLAPHKSSLTSSSPRLSPRAMFRRKKNPLLSWKVTVYDQGGCREPAVYVFDSYCLHIW